METTYNNHWMMSRRRWYDQCMLAIAVMLAVVLTGDVEAQDPGRDYYSAGAYPDGLQMLRNLDRNHYRPAAEKLARLHYVGVQGDLEFMLRYFPNHPQALAAMAKLGLATKRFGLAEQYLKDAIGRYPQYDETYVLYGTFLHRSGRTQDAIVEYKRALDINPASAVGHYNLGLAYVDANKYREANIHAQRAYELGIRYPALRQKLEAAKAWDPVTRGSDSSTNLRSGDAAQRKGEAD